MLREVQVNAQRIVDGVTVLPLEELFLSSSTGVPNAGEIHRTGSDEDSEENTAQKENGSRIQNAIAKSNAIIEQKRKELETK
jgi:hypothetical protein